MSHVVWLSPSPLWDDLLPLGTAPFRAPALLRFASDAFMDDFQALLASEPRQLRGRVARHETWRRPTVGLSAAAGTEPQLKLFQPIHGRFYLVTASLACRRPGLPEHTVDQADAESVSFVLRRVSGNGELAWVTTADGVQGWAAAEPQALAAGEELLPMFQASYAADDLTRRVFAGLIPVGRREAYTGGRSIAPAAAALTGSSAPAGGSAGSGGSAGGSAAGAAPDPQEDPRLIEFQRAVLEPWAMLRDWHKGELVEELKIPRANLAAEQASALILLDFATYLQQEFPLVWGAVQVSSQAASLPAAQKALYDALDLRLWTSAGDTSVHLRQALLNVELRRDAIEKLALPLGSVTTVPGGLTAVLLAGDPRTGPVELNDQRAADEGKIANLIDRPASGPEEAAGVPRRRLKTLVMQALATIPAAAAGPNSVALAGSRPPLMEPLNPRGDDLYVIRCVYRKPRCGKGYAPLVSAPSATFQLASFFDADAPQRPVRVALPVDTSPAALRRFDKNVAFVLSNELRKQMSRVKGLKELMNGDVDSPKGLDISVICSLSIPIITLCALILLMIIVSLLNFIFWWVPFLMMCFPIPSLKAKT